MRLRKRDLTARVNGDLAIEFGRDRLTSFAGLAMLAWYLRRIDFAAMVRETFRRGDVGGVAWRGARRWCSMLASHPGC